jgi:hypothetical protein
MMARVFALILGNCTHHFVSTVNQLDVQYVEIDQRVVATHQQDESKVVRNHIPMKQKRIQPGN